MSSGYNFNSNSVVELDRESPLFDEAIPIALHSTDANSFSSQVYVLRILSGHRSYGSNQNEKLVHIEITVDSDPFFLYVMEVGEQDFHLLKKDQAIVVEFPAFASKLIELLNLTLESSASSSSSSSSSCAANGTNNSNTSSFSSSITRNSSAFAAKLDASTGQFSISETNPFKQIIHISLLLRAGNDATIKTYLASRLKHALKMNSNNTETLTQLQENYATEVAEKREIITEILELKTNRELEVRELKASNAQEIAKLQLQHYEAMEESRKTFELQSSSARTLLDTTRTNYTHAITELEKSIVDLQNEKSQFSFQIRELNRNFDSLRIERDRLNVDYQEVLRQRKESEDFRQKADKENYSLIAKLEAIQVHVKDKEEAVSRTIALHTASQNQCRALEDKIRMLEETIDVLQDRITNGANEIAKGNNIISRFQGENKSLKEKLVMKSQVIRKQESVISELQVRSSDFEEKFNNLRGEQIALTQDKMNLQRQLEETREIVKKNEELLESNKKVISFLNEEQNKWQLGWISGGHSMATPAGKTTGFNSNSVSGNSGRFSSKYITAHSPDSILGGDVTDLSSSTVGGSGGSSSNNRGSSHTNGNGNGNQDWRSWDVTTTASVAIGSNRQMGGGLGDKDDVYRKGLENLGLDNLGLGLGDIFNKDATFRSTMSNHRSNGATNGRSRATTASVSVQEFSLESIDYFSTKPPVNGRVSAT